MPRRSRRDFLIQSACGLFGPASAAWASAAPAEVEAGGAPRLDAPTRAAVARGLLYLASSQNPDGSFGRGRYSRNVAICSLAGVALMAAGNTPGRGEFGGEVRRTVRFILDSADESGFIHAPEGASRGPMYGHGFATLFLAEVYGMWLDGEVREKLTAAVRLIANSQNREGGWRYQPQPDEADISVTVCQIMALRAARNAGIYTASETIDRCVEYVKRSQNEDGGFMYMLQNGGPSRFPRSAAGVVALQSAGVYEGDEVRKGLDYLMQHLPNGDMFNRESYYFYGHYYAAQTMWVAGGERWRRWYPAVRDVLLPRQREDGSWYDAVSPEYGTAMACIILQMPHNQLPIFQR